VGLHIRTQGCDPSAGPGAGMVGGVESPAKRFEPFRPKSDKSREREGTLSKRRTDIIYITGQAFLRAFPSIRHIQRGVFKLFCDSSLVHGPRSINSVVEEFRPLGDSAVVATTDLRCDVSDLNLHLKVRAGPRSLRPASASDPEKLGCRWQQREHQPPRRLTRPLG
jgi:hypothetical protein